jgi:hypothetical protein
MGASPLNTSEIVERLWNDLRQRADVASRTTVPDLPAYEQLVHAEALRYINLNHEGRVPDPQAREVGKGIKRRIRVRLARFVIHVLADYLQTEREFNANVVRVANSVSSGHDRLAQDLHRLVDAMRTESRRLTDEFEMLHHLLESRVAALEDERHPTS